MGRCFSSHFVWIFTILKKWDPDSCFSSIFSNCVKDFSWPVSISVSAVSRPSRKYGTSWFSALPRGYFQTYPIQSPSFPSLPFVSSSVSLQERHCSLGHVRRVWPLPWKVENLRKTCLNTALDTAVGERADLGVRSEQHWKELQTCAEVWVCCHSPTPESASPRFRAACWKTKQRPNPSPHPSTPKDSTMSDVACYVGQLVENELCVSICWQFPAALNFFLLFLRNTTARAISAWCNFVLLFSLAAEIRENANADCALGSLPWLGIWSLPVVQIVLRTYSPRTKNLLQQSSQSSQKIDLSRWTPVLPFAGVWLGDLSNWHVMQSGRRVTVVVFGVGKLWSAGRSVCDRANGNGLIGLSKLQELTLISWEKTCFFHLSCYQVALICHELDSELVGLIGKTWFVDQLLLLIVEQLLLLVVEQLSNLILLSIRDVVRSLVDVEVTWILFRLRLLQFSF